MKERKKEREIRTQFKEWTQWMWVENCGMRRGDGDRWLIEKKNNKEYNLMNEWNGK